MKMLQKRVLLISMVTAFQLHGAGNNALTEGGKDWSRMITITRLIKAGSGAGIVGVGAYAVWSNIPLGDCFSEMPPSLKALLPLVAGYVVSDAVGDHARDKQLHEVCAHLKSHATALGEHGTRLDTNDSALGEHGARLNGIDRVLGEHGTRLNGIDRVLGEHGTRLDTNDSALGEYGTGLDRIATALGDQKQRVDVMEPTVTEWKRLRDERAQRIASRPASAAAFDAIAAEVTKQALQQFSSRPSSKIGADSGAFKSLAAAGNAAGNDDGSGATS